MRCVLQSLSLGSEATFQQQAKAFQVIVAACDCAGASAETHRFNIECACTKYRGREVFQAQGD